MSNSIGATARVDHPGDTAPTMCDTPRIAYEPLPDRGLAALNRLIEALEVRDAA